MRSDKQLYELQTRSKCYTETVDVTDKRKVARRRKGETTTQPRSALGIVAWELAYRAYIQEQPLPVPPDPPPPTPTPNPVIAPRTFNKEGTSDGRFCITGLPINRERGLPFDDFTHYDMNGLDVDGGRDPNYISKKEDGTPLRGAKTMDNYGPCDLYDGLTEWPPDSYHR